MLFYLLVSKNPAASFGCRKATNVEMAGRSKKIGGELS